MEQPTARALPASMSRGRAVVSIDLRSIVDVCTVFCRSGFEMRVEYSVVRTVPGVGFGGLIDMKIWGGKGRREDQQEL